MGAVYSVKRYLLTIVLCGTLTLAVKNNAMCSGKVLRVSKVKARNCDYCGKRYVYERKTSKFCSKSCRVSSHKKQDDISAKLLAAIADVNHISVTFSLKPSTALPAAENLIDRLERSVLALKEQYWAATSKMRTAHGGQVYRHCIHCGQAVFGWKDELPAKCDFCGKDTRWVDSGIAADLGLFSPSAPRPTKTENKVK